VNFSVYVVPLAISLSVQSPGRSRAGSPGSRSEALANSTLSAASARTSAASGNTMNNQ
jgi:hypothetical protein